MPGHANRFIAARPLGDLFISRGRGDAGPNYSVQSQHEYNEKSDIHR